MSDNPETKKAWMIANRHRQKVYSAIYRAKKKGVEPAPELLAQMAEWQAEKAANKKTPADRKEADRRYRARPDVQAKNTERKRLRYQSDPEYRAKQIERNRERYYGSKVELSPERKAEWDRVRREALAKGRKVANAKRVADAIAKEQERKRVAAERKSVQTTTPHTKPKHFHRKPGRLCALMGWRGY